MLLIRKALRWDTCCSIRWWLLVVWAVVAPAVCFSDLPFGTGNLWFSMFTASIKSVDFILFAIIIATLKTITHGSWVIITCFTLVLIHYFISLTFRVFTFCPTLWYLCTNGARFTFSIYCNELIDLACICLAKLAIFRNLFESWTILASAIF